jgi:2-polyprenyl-6-methoxyphenol hydroxylase-like FAD-dependent oxidoreductase
MLQPARAKLLKDAAGPGEHTLMIETDTGSHPVSARCIAIADGRMSANRKLLEIDAEVYQYKNPLLILFAERARPDPRNDLQVLLTPTGIVSVVPRTGGSCKIGLPVDRKELGHWNDASDDEVRERLSTIAPALSELRPSVSGVYPVAMVNAARWSDGNCVLLGDACHALHPGRSQGMNIAFANVASLAQRMQAQNWRESHNAIVRLLTDFEVQERPAIDARLADNHVRGLEMDNIDPQQAEQTIAALRQLAASPEKLHQYCLNAAGY